MNGITHCTHEILYFGFLYTQTRRIYYVILKLNSLLGVNSKCTQENEHEQFPCRQFLVKINIQIKKKKSMSETSNLQQTSQSYFNNSYMYFHFNREIIPAVTVFHLCEELEPCAMSRHFDP